MKPSVTRREELEKKRDGLFHAETRRARRENKKWDFLSGSQRTKTEDFFDRIYKMNRVGRKPPGSRIPHVSFSFPGCRFSLFIRKMIIARSPLRVSLGGGGTDLPSYYEKFGGFLIAAAIDRYVYITLHKTFVPDMIGSSAGLAELEFPVQSHPS